MLILREFTNEEENRYNLSDCNYEKYNFIKRWVRLWTPTISSSGCEVTWFSCVKIDNAWTYSESSACKISGEHKFSSTYSGFAYVNLLNS